MAKKRTIRFYTKEELKELDVYVKGAAPTKTGLADFCKKYNRSFPSVQVLVYKLRKEKENKGKQMKKNDKLFPVASLRKTRSNKLTLNKSEFNIPIKDWSISQHEGQFYFSVKF